MSSEDSTKDKAADAGSSESTVSPEATPQTTSAPEAKVQIKTAPGDNEDKVPSEGAPEGANDSNGGDDDEEVEDGEDGDEEEQEEEEEEEEDGDEEEDVSRRKRRRRDRRNQFLDVEAEVDEEEEDLEEDEEALLKEDGFIQEEVEEEVDDTDDRLHREVDRRREAIAEEDAERLASEYREKYGRSTASKYRDGSELVPQRLLLPSVHDPNIWGIRCKIGREKELVRAILKKKQNLQNSPAPLEIFSAFQRDSFSGYIYLEAKKQAAVTQALKGFANVYVQNTVLIPIKEYPDLLRVNKSKETELVPGTYVRIKRGKYAGDLAIVENLSENGLEARLKVVPRLDYGKATFIDTTNAPLDPTGKRKRPAGSSKARPPPRLFSHSEALQHDPRNVQRRGPNSYIYSGEEYENGYLIKDFRISFLNTESVEPKLEELTRFSNANEEGLDLTSLSQSLKNSTAATSFQDGETVEVFSGEQAGIKGSVVGVQGDIVTIVAKSPELNNQKIEVPANTIRKLFSIGDHVRVINGSYKDETGMVVKISKDNVTVLSDLSQSEVTVFSKDLKAASDIGGSHSLGKFELHDLVQLNAQTVGCIVNIERDDVVVLTPDGQVRTVPPAGISMKVPRSFQFATDRNGNEIRVGDTVKETTGQNRQGTILHIFRSILYLYDRNLSENLGVFVNRSNNVSTISTKGARNENELTNMNPALKGGMAPPRLPVRGGARTRLVGKLVTIGRGSQYKGMNGLVKDENDTIVRIELEAKNKMVTVDKTKVLVNDHNGKVPYLQFVNASRGGSGPSGSMAPPFLGSNENNNHSNSGSLGSATPGWATSARGGFGSGGSRTPAWVSGGSKTPAWSSNAGGRTPAWNSGSRTPAVGHFGDGGRTPAWNAEAPTPGWDTHGTTGATPGSFYSAPTPGFGATPGALGAPTPGVYKDDNLTAPTPGAFDAKTPGVSHTPGVWGLDDTETPRYDSESP